MCVCACVCVYRPLETDVGLGQIRHLLPQLHVRVHLTLPHQRLRPRPALLPEYCMQDTLDVAAPEGLRCPQQPHGRSMAQKLQRARDAPL